MLLTLFLEGSFVQLVYMPTGLMPFLFSWTYTKSGGTGVYVVEGNGERIL